MRKIILIIFIFSFSVFSSCSEDTDLEKMLTGNWYRSTNPEKTVINQYSWGEGKTVINFALEIDLYDSEKSIRLPMIGGPFEITDLKPVDDDTVSLTFFFDRGGFDVTYFLHKAENNAIWFELITNRDLTFIPTGTDFLWYKISGPEM